MGKFKWLTRDGRSIALEDMTSDHLRNTIAMLNRNIEKRRDNVSAGWSMLSMLQGEMAIDCFESDLDQAMEEESEYSRHAEAVINLMQAELRKRRG